jgi:pyruvate,water dikinase
MKYILWLNNIDKEDVELVGGKGANLGVLKRAGAPVPDGFALTSKAYFEFLEQNKLNEKIKLILSKADYKNSKLVKEIADHVKDLIEVASIPQDIISEVKKSYEKLSKNNKYVAVRSSATVEDLAATSFAGQLDSFINLKSEATVLESIKKCWASLYEPRTLFYLNEAKIKNPKIGVALFIQEMIQSDVSGVMFTIDPVTNNTDRLVIESVWGLGSLIVEGVITPDHYEVTKQSMTIIDKKIGSQSKQLILTDDKNKEIPVSDAFKDVQKISDKRLLELAKLGKKIESLYLFPQDIEWALRDEKLYILQSRPVTSVEKQLTAQSKKGRIDLEVLVKGSPASPGITQGIARVVKSVKELGKVNRGDILIFPMSNQDYVPALRKAGAVVTDKGGETSHVAIVSREIGIPCVVGTGIATQRANPGTIVTVNGTKGIVYKGSIPTGKLSTLVAQFEDKKKLSERETDQFKTATKVFVNLVDSTLAAEISQKNVDGVGLLRAEFMMSEVGIHPKKLVEEKKEKALVDKFVEGLKVSCASFDPRPVIYRSVDFTNNEFRQFKGGSKYDREEANPLLGYRGAFRSVSDPEIFGLELEAINIVRNKLNFKNLWLMIPFVRKVEEMAEIKKLVSAAGLHRSPSFKLLMTVEIPSNVVLIDKYLDLGIDGVSIDLANLTTLMIGIDRSNERVFEYFSEADPSVLWSLEHVIAECNKRKVSSIAVGQSSVISHELNEKLVKWGISAISVSPDTIDRTRKAIHESEKKLVSARKRSR